MTPMSRLKEAPHPHARTQNFLSHVVHNWSIGNTHKPLAPATWESRLMPKQTCFPASGSEGFSLSLPRFPRQEEHQFLHQPNTRNKLQGLESGPTEVPSLILSWKELSTGIVLSVVLTKSTHSYSKVDEGIKLRQTAVWALGVDFPSLSAHAVWSWVRYVFALCLSCIIWKIWIIARLCCRFSMKMKLR